MGSKRIYEAARELDLTSKALVQLLRELGFDVKSHMSAFTDEMAAKVAQRLSEEKEAVKEEEKKKEEIKRAAERREAVPKRRRKRRHKKKKRKGRDYAAELRRLEEERRKRREELLKTITHKKVSDAVKRTLALLSQPRKKKKYKKRPAEAAEEVAVKDPNLLEVPEFLTTQELAERLGVPPTNLVAKCFKELGLMVTLNQRLDFDTISLIAEAYGKRAQKIEFVEPELLPEEEEEDESQLLPRPPVATTERRPCWTTYATPTSSPARSAG